MSVIWSILGFVVVMGLIVAIHEWGHYQVAKWFNIKILKFSIGFGKPIYSRQGAETEFVISQIPLGGFVKFADEREAPVAKEDAHRAFNRQSVYKRFAVVLAGPVINLVFAWIIFTVMYMVGMTGFKPIVDDFPNQTPVAKALENNGAVITGQNWFVSRVNGRPVQSWQMVNQQLLQAIANNDQSVDITFNNVSDEPVELRSVDLSKIDINDRDQSWLAVLGLIPAKPKIPAILGELIDGSPAGKAGLETGDKIISIEQIKINHWQDFVKVVQSYPDVQVELVYERNGAQFSTQVQLMSSASKDGRRVGKMGVGVLIDEATIRPYQAVIQFGLYEAMGQAYQRSVDLLEMSLVMLKRMVLGEVSTENLSGPISIAQFSGQALQSGLISFLSLLGLLSLSIGVLNLLPIPILDGGHLMFYIVEIIKGSPVSEQAMVLGNFIGLIMIVGLTFLAVFNDVLRIFHG